MFSLTRLLHGSDDNRSKSFLLSVALEMSLEADSAASELYHASLPLLKYLWSVAGD